MESMYIDILHKLLEGKIKNNIKSYLKELHCNDWADLTGSVKCPMASSYCRHDESLSSIMQCVQMKQKHASSKSVAAVYCSDEEGTAQSVSLPVMLTCYLNRTSSLISVKRQHDLPYFIRSTTFRYALQHVH
jgi:hypothetical protein